MEILGEMSDNPFQYTGRENDGTGLYYYRFRYYSPLLKRFISEDPLKQKNEELNFYLYVENSPVNFIDTLGQFKGNPRKDFPGFFKCIKRLIKCAQNIDTYREQCRQECTEGKHGGSMYRCALDKCWKDFQDCLKFAVPGG